MAQAILHGLIQKALITASELKDSYRINPNGDLWAMTPLGWMKTGEILKPQDAEDFLVGKLTQEDR